MKISKRMLVGAVLLPLAIGLGGCSSAMIGVRPGAERVSVANKDQVGACQSKGRAIVGVLTQVGFINRDAEDVEENLLQLARNNAADAGADTLVKGDSPEFGKRTFEMFKCRH